MPIAESIMITLSFVYFLPSIIAAMKKKKAMVDILVFNTFLGWTIIGWIAALIWAAFNEKPGPTDKKLSEVGTDLISQFLNKNKNRKIQGT